MALNTRKKLEKTNGKERQALIEKDNPLSKTLQVIAHANFKVFPPKAKPKRRRSSDAAIPVKAFGFLCI